MIENIQKNEFKEYLFFLLLLLPILNQAQTFTRSVLSSPMDNPWEIIYGPDDFLWVTEKFGTVTRVNPITGIKHVVYTASDYFSGDNSEDAPCGRPIGANTYGLALHPDFLNPDLSFIYYIYSYNSGTDNDPATLFKIVKLTWDAANEVVVANENLVTDLSNGYDHYGYRMIAVHQNGNDYLYYSIGDTSSNDESCYDTPADNPNLLAQEPDVLTGKIHRINIDGTIPLDNPIPSNSFFTRGHRNPQGLAYNPNMDVLYGIEHGHKTDDEINVLEAGMNYGWKNVKGYHDDNYPDELDFVNNYVPHPDIANDELKEPLFSWGAELEPNGGFLSWPTVAPSDGIYYGSEGVTEWTNSLLVVTLKNGDDTSQEVFQFKLNPDGVTLADATPDDPNPKQFFGEDQNLNGRLRDITISPDGKKIFLITNTYGNESNPIIIYTLEESNATTDLGLNQSLIVNNHPNPFSTETNIYYETKNAGTVRIEITNMVGQKIKTLINKRVSAGNYSVNGDGTGAAGQQLPDGVYFYTVSFEGIHITRKVILSK
jgi:glucose/arabinose dehydrogenase